MDSIDNNLYPCIAGETSHNHHHQRLRKIIISMDEEETHEEYKSMMARNDGRELYAFACMLTSEPEPFLKIIKNKEGSKRVTKLLGKSSDSDEIYLNAIAHMFFDVMTNEHSYVVALHAMQVFNKSKSSVLLNLALSYTYYLASDAIGCIALNHIITETNDDYVRNKFYEEVGKHVGLLCEDDSVTFVVQTLLKTRHEGWTNYIAFQLLGGYVDLAFHKSGSYILELILESGSELATGYVVNELLESGGEKLYRMAESEFGDKVVLKALEVMWSERKVDLFWGLVEMLWPFLDRLYRSSGRDVAEFIDSTVEREFGI